MDLLKQTKLSKSEWETLEVPVTESEARILALLKDGYENTRVVHNHSQNMIQFSKLPCNDGMHHYIYTKYFQSLVDAWKNKYGIVFAIESRSIKKLKSADTIRIQNMDQNIQQSKEYIYEFVCMDLCKQLLKKLYKKENAAHELYTLMQWRKASLEHKNPHVMDFLNTVIEKAGKKLRIRDIVTNATQLIEKNKDLYKYDDLTLFPHQRDIFTFCRMHKDAPKLVLYTAPTGTGKTLTPIGLSEGYKIVFVCVARHIGLALAKSAISVGKRVAFAFGCETASDIRLHYFAAVDYERNKRSGGIGKVDNSNGSAVEIMICDVQSYTTAMYYMQAFNDPKELLLYWDEPTMTLDYEEHELHTTIHSMWTKNTIPNVVLSCATLPNEQDIQECIQDFRAHFLGAMVHTITSYDCKKSIPIINTEGHCFMPHIHCASHREMQEYAMFCEDNKTLLRYFDLDEIVRFVTYMHDDLDMDHPLHMDHYFDRIEDVTMNHLKLYYLEWLTQCDEKTWKRMHQTLSLAQTSKFTATTKTSTTSLRRMQSMPNESQAPPMAQEISRMHSDGALAEKPIKDALAGVLLTTRDAHSLTDGPTIYLADNLLNLAKFYVQQSKIPEFVLKQLMDHIRRNDELQKAIQEMEEKLEAKLQVKDNTDTTAPTQGKHSKSSANKPTREKIGSDDNTQVLKDNLEQMKRQMAHLSLQPEYIPNRTEHRQKWAPTSGEKSFTQNVDEKTVKEIMDLEIHTHYKILVLMGIGVLIKQDNKQYEEIVKRLAQEQKLFMILASSDFIYGTNYQFCHGFIGKDLPNMTPQKILQSMGRIGRNSTQQDYSVRFRNDDMIHKLFRTPEVNREAINMNALLCRED